MAPLRLILAGALIAAWTGWSLATILRRGAHGRIDWRRKLGEFRGSIAAMSLFLMFGLALIVYGLARAAGLFA